MVEEPRRIRRTRPSGGSGRPFRSAFHDWAGDKTNFQREVAEAALAHAVGDETDQAYRRGDALEKRRELMDWWAYFCFPSAAEVASLGSRRRGP